MSAFQSQSVSLVGNALSMSKAIHTFQVSCSRSAKLTIGGFVRNRCAFSIKMCNRIGSVRAENLQDGP